MEKKIITTEIPLAKQKVLLENVEVSVCSDCGEIFFDGAMLLKLEAELLGKQSNED